MLLIIGVIYLAILYMLVRPNSTGVNLIYSTDPKTGQPSGILATFADLVRGIAGESFDQSTGQWRAPQ